MLRDVLKPELVATGVRARTRDEVIETLLDLVCGSGEVSDRDQARADVLANERRSSTGMQHGVAIPHAKTRAVTRLLAAVAVTAEPVEFDSLDGRPCRIFVMTLSPPDSSGPHLRFLAEIGRLLKDRHAREALLAARDPAELLRAFVAG